ncbi:MAG TPA: flagellar hook-basal body protein [Bacillota bacterium]|nr:flagellar hook-basal body protein [Bacillota bacterium]
MSRMMLQAAVTMQQLQHKLDIVGHNIANSQTTGYKARQADFQSLLFQQINNLTDPRNGEGRLTPDGIRVGSGAKLGAINQRFTAGAMIDTERALDVALLNDYYFFQVEVTDGETTETRLTRDGSFYLSPINDTELLLTDADGHPVIGANGRITIPKSADHIQINPNGQVVVKEGQLTNVIGTLNIVEAIRPRVLEAVGQNFFRLPDVAALGYNADDIIINRTGEQNVLRSGALEQSNVDIAEEMTDMLLAQRSYQFNARSITMGDQMLGLINQLR